MRRWRAAGGAAAALMLILSAGAHSLLGGPRVEAELRAAGVTPELLLRMRVGWQFGGLAMLALGAMLLVLFVRRLRGERVPVFPAVITAAAYLLFGGWALWISGNPFFFIFIVPGALLALAATGRHDTAA
jgi:hypothetical protein